jgi:hypothetical protein
MHIVASGRHAPTIANLFCSNTSTTHLPAEGEKTPKKQVTCIYHSSTSIEPMCRQLVSLLFLVNLQCIL